MALDEDLFGRLHRWWARRRRNRAAEGELRPEDQAARWDRLVWLVAGRELRVAFGPGAGRVGESVRLPDRVPVGVSRADAEAFVMLRLALAAAADNTACSVAIPLAEALPHLMAWLDREWPGVRRLLPAAARHAATAGLVEAGAAEEAVLAAALDGLPAPAATAPAVAPRGPVAPREALPAGTEREKTRRAEVEVIAVDERDDGANPLAHVFEKVRTAEEHTGGNRAMDGSDELAEHLDALEELDLRRVVRSHRATSSVFRADVEFAAAGAELPSPSPAGAATARYDEWDDRSRRYLRDWCAVHAAIAASADRAATAAVVGPVRARHAATIHQLRAEFARLVRGRVLQNRQPVGSDLDLDAIVERYGDLRAAARGAAAVGEARLYTARRPAARDVAVLLLLDRSLSSDSWVAGRRVLDTTREAVLVLGEALAGVRLPVAIGAFCSHTRNDCRYEVVAGFAEPWSLAQRRLVALRPDGYTRVGPALRHATAQLAAQPARRRLLLVLSDCKPVDYDHYEGRHGIGDVRQAVREARAAGVETLALAIDRAAPAHLPQMFGPAGFRVLPDAGQLARVLARLHERLLRR